MVRNPAMYFCCMVAGNRAFVQQNTVAIKGALRAILKAADVCDTDWRFLNEPKKELKG